MSTQPKPNEPGQRQCLKCSQMFQSRGAGNRICKKCSAVNAALHVSEAEIARERGAKRMNGLPLDPPNSYESSFF
jgi:hypothetical protein